MSDLIDRLHTAAPKTFPLGALCHEAAAEIASLRSQLEEARRADEWRDISTAPKDRDILVWFDHEEDSYQDPKNQDLLTNYAAWAESGEFMDGKGICIARWQTAHWESEDEYGNGYWLPEWWFSKENDDYERVVNPTNWLPLPAPPAIQSTDAKEVSE